MVLKSLDYEQYPKQKQHWSLKGLNLGQINLIVGKNAAGKTRTINVIQGLAKIVSDSSKLTYVSGAYYAQFSNGVDSVYRLEYDALGVCREELTQNGKKLIDRKSGRQNNKLWFEKEGRMLDFDSPADEVTVSNRQDKVQHSYLASYRDWGNSTLTCRFSKFEQEPLMLVSANRPPTFSKADKSAVLTYVHGYREYHDDFDAEIIRHMAVLGYRLDNVGVDVDPDLTWHTDIPPDSAPLAFYVQEKGFRFKLFQKDISQGMYRALAIIVTLCYLEFSKESACLLIDDIGEGLDYDRATKLVSVALEIASRTSIQLIMSTNDRFIMNAVSLEHWIVLVRNRATVRALSHHNSKEAFERFRETGLNNFDFFATDAASRFKYDDIQFSDPEDAFID